MSSPAEAAVKQPRGAKQFERQAAGGKLDLALYRLWRWLHSPKPYLMLVGFAVLIGFWYYAVEVQKLPRFKDLPGLTVVITEWLSKEPSYGISIYTPEYYKHIVISLERVGLAFGLSTLVGVPLGLFLGWSRTFKEYVFPLFELFRPIPALAWIPMSIVLFQGTEAPIVFLTCIAPFFATTLNTMLGVESIDVSYTRAASCLGATRWQIFQHIVLPGALPFIFTGLEISMGLCWFSLVAGEMLSGNYGLGYLIIFSFMNINYPTIVIGMLTLGVVGYCTSALVRIIGNFMMQWRVRELALGR